MNTKVRFTFDKVVFDKANSVHSLLTLSAPKLNRTSKRPPICVVPVIDVSGSMGDYSKLEYAKKSVQKLIDHLRPGDYFGAASFESSIRDIFPVTAVDDSSKEKMRSEISKLRAMGGTNMVGGILRGLELVNGTDLPKETLIRVILFTDGCANVGPAQSCPDITRMMVANMGPRATLSMFGYGHDADQEMLASLAKSGKGNYSFIDNPDKAASAFGKELGGLLSTYAQNISILVTPQGGHEIVKIISDVDATEVDEMDKSKGVRIEIPDILSEETRHIALELSLAAQTSVLPRPLNVLLVEIEYDLIDDDGKKTHKKETVKGKMEFVKDGDEQKKPDTDVNDIVVLHMVFDAQLEAEKLAASGNYQAAHVLMKDMGHWVGAQGAMGLMGSQGCQGAVGVANYYADMVEDSASYATTKGARSSLRSAGSSNRIGLTDTKTSSVLFSASMSCANSMERGMMDSFTVGGDSVTVDPNGGVQNPNVVLSPSLAIEADKLKEEEKKSKKSKLGKSRSQRW